MVLRGFLTIIKRQPLIYVRYPGPANFTILTTWRDIENGCSACRQVQLNLGLKLERSENSLYLGRHGRYLTEPHRFAREFLVPNGRLNAFCFGRLEDCALLLNCAAIHLTMRIFEAVALLTVYAAHK
jgi:hypothetical protein